MAVPLFAALLFLPVLQEPAPARGAAAERSAHAAQERELGERLHEVTDDGRALDTLERAGALPRAVRGPDAARPEIAAPYVVFGYLQSEAQVYHTRWQALTHVGTLFVTFDANGHLVNPGTFTNRSSFLRAGGAAEAAGVKVILVVNSFDDAPGGAIETVMTSAALRSHLAGEIAQLLVGDSYSQGVSLDLEFSWGPAVRDGITAFAAELRADLDALGPGYELSFYVGAIFRASQWDFDAASGLTPLVDYVLFSMYDWATGTTVHAMSDLDDCLAAGRLQAYLDDGLPPEKLVPVVSTYSRRWSGASSYNATGSAPVSSGFTDALYDVTLNPLAGGPYANHHVRGDEAGWYTWNDGVQRARTWESPEALEVELRQALSLRDARGIWNGRRLGGVGFWSLYWMAETTSFDPRTGQLVARTRTYPQVYRLCQEILGRKDGRGHLVDGFEGLDPRWRDPNESPDTVGDADGDSGILLVPTPDGPGRPAASTNALRLVIDLEGSGANRLVLAYEVLASDIAPAVTDLDATAGHMDATSAVVVDVHAPRALPGYAVRLLAIDEHGELESSPPFAIAAAGWRRLAWDLTAPGAVQPFVTAEPAFRSGDGVLDTSAPGARDLSVYGFALEGQGPLDGVLTFDELAVEPRTPGGRAYTINELRGADPARELVEVHGPSGPLPPGLELRFYDAATGGVLSSVALTGSIPDDGGGQGLFVVGDPLVPNVDLAGVFSAARDDVPDTDPSAAQLVDPTTGVVYDSLVWEAFGGLDELVRPDTLGVTGDGDPWVGEIASGTDAAGEPYSMGRWPDGADTRANARDFSFQPASPGLPNGGSVTLPARFSFDSPPARAFQTYDAFSVASPSAAGLPDSPDGGKAWRCVDPAGGGVIGVVGDAALGADQGVRATCWLYVARADEPPQAVAVGIAGRQGSTFFSSTARDRSGYESGSWLIYENREGVGLADGLPDHPGALVLVQATNDNRDGAPVDPLASVPLSATGVAPGSWLPVELVLRGRSAGADQLEVRAGATLLYRGPLPPGAPRSGAFQVGFRENHAGPPAAGEGAWVDGLALDPAGPSIPLGRAR